MLRALVTSFWKQATPNDKQFFKMDKLHQNQARHVITVLKKRTLTLTRFSPLKTSV